MPQEAGIRARPEEGVSVGERGSVCSCEAEGLECARGWLGCVFLSREKERKTTLSMELKIEPRAGQAVAWKGGGCFFLGLSPALAGLGPGGVRGSIEEERMALPGDANVS